MTTLTEYLKIYSPPNFREVYKCFNKEISVTWHTTVLPMSLPPPPPPKEFLFRHYIICSSSKAAGNKIVYDPSDRDTPLIISHDSHITTSVPIHI
jgi:hypothetical protein